MNSSWREYILDQVIECFIDYRGKTPRKTSSGIPLITAKIVKNGKILEPTEFIAEEDYISWMRRGLPKLNDVVLTTEAPLGEVAILKNENVALAQRIIIMRGIKNILDNKFLKYFFQSKYGQEELHIRSSGTTVTGIKSSELKKISLFCPCYKEQKNIAAILGSLDDKIDLLQRQNATLEAMAETLFRQWFIEEAQEDFRITSLSNIANFLNGLACQKYPPSNNIDKLPVLKIRELNNGISKDCDWATSDIKSEYIVKSGDVIFSWSGSLLVKIWNGEDCVLNQHLFKVTSQTYPKWFYFFWCKYHLKEFIIISESHATTMGHIKRSDLDAAEVLIPSDKRLQEMSYIMNPLWEKYITNQTQIRTLEKLRDTLLPKLMSGEVRVRVDG